MGQASGLMMAANHQENSGHASECTTQSAATLIFGWGNPSRGDDAIGPQMTDFLCAKKFNDVEVLTDFQLQIEHVMDLEHRQRVLFIDASLSASAPFEFYRLQARQDDSYTSHAMSPQALLSLYESTHKQPAPLTFMLSIRGYEFELGAPMSEQASTNLTIATAFIEQQLTGTRAKRWVEVETKVCGADLT